MRIGIDIRCLAEGRRTGVEEYTLHLLEYLFSRDTKNEYVLFFNSWKKCQTDLRWIEKYSRVKLKIFRFPNKIFNLMLWYFHWPKLDTLLGGVDVFFMPNIMFGSVSQKTRFVLTVHDVSFERYPETFSRKRRLWHALINSKKLCQRVDKIISVSQSTKDDLISLYEIASEKIQVIHSAVSDVFCVIDRNDEQLIKTKEKYKLPYKFVLYLGTIEPRKNIVAIVRAYNQLQEYAKKYNLEEFTKYKLVIAGEKGWLSSRIFSEIAASPYKNSIRMINFVEDEDKVYVYNLASLFVYTSFFEGFGFPPLEAMKCGVPVITSNNSSIPEVVGDAGIMIDPDKPYEIFQAMREILSSKELQMKLRKEGLERAKQFEWKKTAEKTLDVFLSL